MNALSSKPNGNQCPPFTAPNCSAVSDLTLISELNQLATEMGNEGERIMTEHIRLKYLHRVALIMRAIQLLRVIPTQSATTADTNLPNL